MRRLILAVALIIGVAGTLAGCNTLEFSGWPREGVWLRPMNSYERGSVAQYDCVDLKKDGVRYCGIGPIGAEAQTGLGDIVWCFNRKSEIITRKRFGSCTAGGGRRVSEKFARIVNPQLVARSERSKSTAVSSTPSKPKPSPIYPSHQYGLGVKYEFGLYGVRKDIGEAFRWYLRAARQGHPSAQYAIGSFYERGRAVPKDLDEALKWYRKAAARNVAAEFALHRLQRAASRTSVPEPEAPQAPPTASTLPAPPSPPSVAPPAPTVLVVTVQQTLIALGYDPGPADGVLGAKTRAAIRDFQKDVGLAVTGEVSHDLAVVLDLAIRERNLSREAQLAKVIEALRKEPKQTKLEKHSTGSGFAVSPDGHILTNRHVVDGCGEVRIAGQDAMKLLASDAQNDLALLKAPPPFSNFATLRGGRGVRLGDTIVVAGFPLQGLLTSDLTITTGTVSALAGPDNDRRYLQITAPVQQGNSGGPLLDLSGNVVGVVVGKLDAVGVAALTGDIPQNVNFAISAWVARGLLDAYSVRYEAAKSVQAMPAADVASEAQKFTVLVECWK